MKTLIFAALLSTALAGPALAQATGKPSTQAPPSATDAQMPMSDMSGKTMDANMRPYAKENMAAMDKMNGPMMDAMKAPNADEAFVRGMIPHHQGAIDMANVVLKYGKDEQVKAWANDIIRAQSKEKAEFEAWLKTHAK